MRVFVRVSSPFYAQVGRHYERRANAWYQAIVLERLDDEIQGLDDRETASGRAAVEDPLEVGWELLRAGELTEAEQLLKQAEGEKDPLLGRAAAARKRGENDVAMSLFKRWQER